MSSIGKYAQFISNQQKTLEVDGKLISEREVLINRLMAEGYTSKQIEFILEQEPSTYERFINFLTPESVKKARAAKAAQNASVADIPSQTSATVSGAITQQGKESAAKASEADIPSTPSASSSGPPVSARSAQSSPSELKPRPGSPAATGTRTKQSSLSAQLRKVGGNAPATSDTAAGRAKIALLDKAKPQRDWKKDVFER